jgi:hypothetical protein
VLRNNDMMAQVFGVASSMDKEQSFPIHPDTEDPGACNVPKDLKFLPEVHEQIACYYEGNGYGGG